MPGKRIFSSCATEERVTVSTEREESFDSQREVVRMDASSCAVACFIR
jgi:hypothetical protein